MNLLRNILVGAIAIVVFMLFLKWNDFQERHIALLQEDQTTLSSLGVEETRNTAPATESTSVFDISEEPEAEQDTIEVPEEWGEENTPAISPETKPSNTQLISIKTNTLHLLIDPVGGDIIKVALTQYLSKLEKDSKPFVLLNRSRSHTYIAESELLVSGKPAGKKGRLSYSSDQSDFVMSEEDEKLVVDLSVAQDSIKIIKRFTFKRDSYLVDVEFIVDNQGQSNLPLSFLGQIKRDNHKPSKSVGFGIQPFLGAAVTTPETNYKKYDFGDLDKATNELDFEKRGGWVALVQHYFISAWIPDAELNTHYYFRKSKGLYVLKFISDNVDVKPGSIGTLKSSFYAGPKTMKTLEKISPYLDLTIDFSWLWFIAKPLYYFLSWIHSWVGNWGIAIILLTMTIKAIFIYPTAISYKSMAKMRKIAPKMQELKERYGEDRQKMSSELMKLYKKEGANPVSGCLPMILPMPVFIALYWVLMESVELRHSPFFFWINDLSVKDPWFVLPFIMGVSMYFMQKLNPAPADPTQAKVMQMMPIFFTFMFLWFPAGLVLYWVVNNLLSMTQQYIITKRIERE